MSRIGTTVKTVVMTGGNDVLAPINVRRRTITLSTSNVGNTQFAAGDPGVGDVILNTTRTSGAFTFTRETLGEVIFRTITVNGAAADVATIVETFDVVD